MQWTHGLLLIVCFVFGGLTSYIDLDSELKRKNIAYVPNKAAYLFFFANGLISAALLCWAFLGGESSLISKVTQVESPIAQMLVISLGTPLIIRSKLFSHKDFEAGPAQIYNWSREAVLFSINRHAGQLRLDLVDRYSERLSQRDDRESMIRELVDEINKVKDQKGRNHDIRRLEKISREAMKISPQEHAGQLIRFALDSTRDIPLVESYLEKRLSD